MHRPSDTNNCSLFKPHCNTTTFVHSFIQNAHSFTNPPPYIHIQTLTHKHTHEHDKTHTHRHKETTRKIYDTIFMETSRTTHPSLGSFAFGRAQTHLVWYLMREKHHVIRKRKQLSLTRGKQSYTTVGHC